MTLEHTERSGLIQSLSGVKVQNFQNPELYEFKSLNLQYAYKMFTVSNLNELTVNVFEYTKLNSENLL